MSPPKNLVVPPSLKEMVYQSLKAGILSNHLERERFTMSGDLQENLESPRRLFGKLSWTW